MSAPPPPRLRRAIVSGAALNERTVAAYLPDNYAVVGTLVACVLIEGHDDAGWTLDGYVIPRLASGLMGCVEIDDARLAEIVGREAAS